MPSPFQLSALGQEEPGCSIPTGIRLASNASPSAHLRIPAYAMQGIEMRHTPSVAQFVCSQTRSTVQRPIDKLPYQHTIIAIHPPLYCTRCN
jgi:hypothetical protein